MKRTIGMILCLALLCACQAPPSDAPSPSVSACAPAVSQSSPQPPPAEDAPPAEQPPTEQLPTEQPPTEQPTEQPPAEQQSPEQPPPEEKTVPEEPPKPANTKLYILMYHDVVEGDGTGCDNWTITTDRLRQDLQWLADHGYQSVLPSQVAAGEPLPQRAVLITFDDGYASNYTLAFPLLQEFNAKAVISLITTCQEQEHPRFLTWDMCREMAESGLVEFGSHTYDCHQDTPPGIKRLKGESREDYEERVFSDIQRSIDMIEENLGMAPIFFAYPSGLVDTWADEFLKEHFQITVITRHGPVDISNGLYKLKRINVSLKEPAWRFLPK